jgi:glucokinase
MIDLSDRVASNDTPRRFAIGLDLGGTQLKYGIVTDRGEVAYSNVADVPSDPTGAQVLAIMAEAAHACTMFARMERITLEAVGAGCPGTIDPESGRSLAPTPHLLEWEGSEIARTLSDATGLPAFADNDANLMAFAEYLYGAGRGAQSFVGITLGTGVGGGIVLNGEIYRGERFNAAELGHVVVEAEGRPCRCGNRGCLERYVGSKYIVQDAVQAMKEGTPSLIRERVRTLQDVTPKIIFEAAGLGDELGKQLVRQVVSYLGAGLASIVHVLSPGVIAIGGGMSEAGDTFVEWIREEVRGRVMKPAADHLSVVRAELGSQAGLVGSAAWAFRRLRTP